jgi:hypothetical protein
MANILFVVVENLRQYRRSPLLEESVLHLVYESAAPNNGMHPTANSVALMRKTPNRSQFVTELWSITHGRIEPCKPFLTLNSQPSMSGRAVHAVIRRDLL